MYKTYKNQAHFYLVYLRESHPADAGKKFGGKKGGGAKAVNQPKTFEERCKVAGDFVKDLKLAIPTLVDGIDNKVGMDYGAFPDRIYVIGKDGKIFFKAERGPFGFKPDEAEAALKNILASAQRSPKEAQPIFDLQTRYGKTIMVLPGVNGHGIGMKDKKYALMILVVDESGKKNVEAFLEKTNKNKAKDSLEGHPVLIDVVGVIRPQ